MKEQVYAPDWTTPERVEYTNRLFDILAQLVPEGVEGSVSTVPGSFKEFIKTRRASGRYAGQSLALPRTHRRGEPTHRPQLAPGPGTGTALFSGNERRDRHVLRSPAQPSARTIERLDHLGVNYDTCHLAVEFEEPLQAVSLLEQHKIKLSKIHLSSALKVRPTLEVCRALQAFADDTYLHQVIEQRAGGKITRYRDLDVALAQPPSPDAASAPEWRIHFHIPLHSPPTPLFDNTRDHILGLLDLLKLNPTLCSHLEMETYTWEVMPPEMKNRSVRRTTRKPSTTGPWPNCASAGWPECRRQSSQASAW